MAGSVPVATLAWLVGESVMLLVVPLAAVVWAGIQLENRRRMLQFIEWEIEQEEDADRRRHRLEAFRRGEWPPVNWS